MESNEESEYRNRLLISAQSLADKMAILEARDRLMRLKRMRQTDLATAVAVVGACPDMCPELERYFRQETNQMSLFEMDANTGRPDPHRMVKEYRRSGADQEEPLAHELRPTPVLNRTMDYLCTNVMDALDVNTSCGEWYDFVWSRTRSIRKDITQQHLCDEQVVALTEKCARFHIHCSATLCEQNVKDFDPKINEENLSNCLQSLKDFYYDLSLRDIFCPNESEFRCYEILLHLNDTAILKDVQNYRQQIRDSRGVQIAIKAFFAYQSNNYIKFFEVFDKCSYLMSCILHRYFLTIRQKAFKILRKCYTSNPSSIQEYPSQSLISCLGFEDSHELKAFCDHIGLECGQGIVYLMRGHNQNNPIKAKRSVRLVENKRIVSVGQVINGSPLPANPYKVVVVHNSFNSDGLLKADALEATDQKTKIIGSTESGNHLRDSLNSNTDFKYCLSINQNTEFSPNITSSLVSDQSSRYSQNLKTIDLRTQLNSKTANCLVSEITSNPIQNEFYSFGSICESIAQDILEEVLKSELLDICDGYLQNLLNQILEQTICDVFSDIFLNTCDQMIKEISSDVLQNQIQAKQMQIIDRLSADILDNLVAKEVQMISNQVIVKSKQEFELILQQNTLIANQLFTDLVDCMIEEIASNVVSDENDRKEKFVEQIRHKRDLSLQSKYFYKWKDWFLRKKRLNYLWQSFPAAPKCTSNKLSSNGISFALIDLSFDDSFNKSLERELLANNLLNILIDSIIKEISSNVFQSLVSPKTQFFEYFQQKRQKRIACKYFAKWRQFCAQKRQYCKRYTFPAAPNRKTNESLSSKNKYSFSYLDSENQISAKRLRLEVSQTSILTTHLNADNCHKSQSIQSLSDSILNIKPSLDIELSESRALTQRLAKEIDGHKNIAIHEINDQLIEGQYGDEQHIQVIPIFESQTDKINRLKRMLSEEKDYFSLNNFVKYLNDNN